MYSKETYARNYSILKRKHAMRQICVDYILSKKTNKPCADCGQVYPPYVMDFDHVVGEKKFNIAQKAEYTSIRKIQSEIDKCELVCANCHRIRTHARKIVIDK